MVVITTNKIRKENGKMNEGLQTALNQIRESIVSDNKVYQESGGHAQSVTGKR